MRSWLVRQLASALSDYVEGISPETVQTSLGRDIGHLNLTGARVNPQAVERYGLELLCSELSVEAEVPWRHLFTQPTKLIVKTLQLELRLRPRQNEQPCAEAKEAQVKKLEDELVAIARQAEAEEGSGFFSGRIARLSHAILRQLRVTIGRSKATVYHELPSKAPLTLSLGESGLQSVGSDWTSLPTEASELRKVLRLSGFQLDLGGQAYAGQELRLFGPLSVQAKLLHSPEQALVKLWLELPQEADAAFQINPEALQELRSWCDWMLAEFLSTSDRELPEAAGRRYASVYCQKLKGQPYDELVLSKMEATASARWLATWRSEAHLQLASKSLKPLKTSENSWSSWITWAKGASEAPVREAWAEKSDDVFSVEALLDEVDSGELPELATPTRFEVDMRVSQYTALCKASGGLLKASVGGAASLDFEVGTNTKLCVTVKLVTMAICLDERPLMQLLNRHALWDEASWDCDDRRLEPGAGLQFQLLATGISSPAPDVTVSLLGEAIHFEVAPRTLHGALRSASEAFSAWRPESFEHLETTKMQRMDIEAASAASAAGAAGAAAAWDTAKLCLTLEVEAPILRLEAWQGALEIHLGHFSGKSVRKERLQENRVVSLVDLIQICEAEAIDLQHFGLMCELRDTRINLTAPGESDRFAYEPSTIVLGAARTDEGGEIHAESTRVRCHIDPDLLRFFGHLWVGLDFALAPLYGEIGKADASPARLVTSTPRCSPSTADTPWKFDLCTGSFDIIWDPQSGHGDDDASVRCHIAGVSVQVRQDKGMVVEGSAQDAAIECGKRRLLSSIGHVDVRANWSEHSVQLALTAPPLQLRWSSEAVKQAFDAPGNIQRSLAEGQSEALKRCPREECHGITSTLWERFVAERTEQFRDAIDQAVKEIDPEISSKTRQVEVSIKSQELRAGVVRPGAIEEEQALQATMCGLECRLNSGEGLSVTTKLSSVEVWLGRRLLLAPRQADIPLLQAVLSCSDVQREGYDLQVTWAQIALVYRQRDFEQIAELCREEISLPSPLPPQASSGDPADVSRSERGERPERPWRYRFDIDAPLLFLPASRGDRGGALSSSRDFQALPEEGYAILDLGNCLVQSDPSTAVMINLTRLQVFFASGAQPWNQILRPVTAEVEVQSAEDSLDIRVLAPLGKATHSHPLTETDRSRDPNISLTRAHATQFFDVLYLNFSYASADEVDALREALKVRLEELSPGRGFLFSLRWTGALTVDAGFTPSSKLARLEVMDGCFEYKRPSSKGEAVPRYIHFQCQGGCVRDARSDFMGLLIDLPCQDLPCQLPCQESLGLRVLATMPAEPDACTRIDVDLREPNLWLLPQLWTDVLTWVLSAYQQTAQAAVDTSTSQETSMAILIEVNLRDGAVRLPIAWETPAEHFALVGDLLLGMRSEGNTMSFEKITMPNASLRRVSVAHASAAQNRLLCEKLSFFAKVVSDKQVVSGTRISVYRAELVKIHSFNLRITLQDILELTDMMQAMAAMEAESVEPQDEIRARDPLSLEQPQKMTVDTSFELDGVHLQILAPRPVLEFSLGCPLTSLSFSWARGSTPMGNICVERLWLRLAILNERLAAWEPMLGTSEWNLEFLCRRQHGVPRAEAEIQAQPISAIQVAVTLPMIHACSRLVQSYQDAVTGAQEAKAHRKRTDSFEPETAVKRFEDSLVGINLSGLDCFAISPILEDLHSFLDGNVSSAIRLAPRATSLDAVSHAGKVSLQLRGDGKTKTLDVKAGVSTVWDTCEGCLLVQVLVPRPPQLVLVISSQMILANRTLLDLEVKLLNVDLSLSKFHMASEWPPFAVPTKLLDDEQEAPSSIIWKREAGELVTSHALCLPSGFYLALPPKALQRQASFQLRPSPESVGGMNFSWGGAVHPITAMETDSYAAYSRSVCPDFNLPAYGLRLSTAKTQELWKISIQAPFSLCNACPVDLSYHLCWSNAGFWAPRVLQEAKDRCDADGVLHVWDGYGGVWNVPPNGFIFVAPLRLNHGLQWEQGGRRAQRDCPKATNFVQVKRDGQKVTWQFCDVSGHHGLLRQQPMRLAPGDEVPIYELPEQIGAAPSGGVLRQALHRNEESLPPLLLSVCLSQGRAMSPWCPALPVLVEGEIATVPLDLGSNLRLQCDRQPRKGYCKATIYASCWFHNATGLEVLLVRGQEPPPVYNNLAVMDDAAWANVDDEQDIDGFKVILVGTGSPIRLPFVGIGQSAKLRLSSTHDCILKSDFISASSSHGVGSTLFSLIPALLAFNTLGYGIGFRQEGSRSVTWLEPNTGRSAIYWSAPGSRRKLQLAVRDGERCGDWSTGFEISEQGIGCFPIHLSDGLSKERLFCVQIQQCSSQLVTLTLAGPEACHQLMNRHPCLVVDACFTDDSIEDPHVVAVHRSKVAFGSSGRRRINTKQTVKLVFGDIASRKSTSMELPLDRPVNRTIDFDQYPISIRLEVVQRVAHITVSPVGFLVGGLDENNALSWTVEAHVRIPALNIGIRSNDSHSENFACHLTGLNLQVRQTEDIRDTTIELQELQIDHSARRRKKSHPVIFASLTQPQPWRLKVVRQQLNESDVILRSISVEFFPSRDNEGVVVESTVSEELIKEMKDLLKGATPSQLEGLCLFELARWAGRPYYQTLAKPPAAARKYVLHDFQCGELKIGLWCTLSYSTLPSFVGAMLTLSSFSSTLDVGGARVKLERQSFFTRSPPFEGSLEALANLVVERYKPCVRHSWRSIINNSNAVLGGLFSRHAWNPRQQSKTKAKPAVLCLRNGVVILRSEMDATVTTHSALRREERPERPDLADVSLDEKGFQQVLASKDLDAMQLFLRRLLALLGAKVTNKMDLASYAKSLGYGHSLDEVVDFIFSKECTWAMGSDTAS